LTLGVEKIHACLNHCSLYQKEHKFKDKCPRCNASRYKWNDNIEEDSYNNKRKEQKRKNTAPPEEDSQVSKERKVHVLVMWYLPVIDRLKRMFSNAREAQLLLGMFNERGMERSDILLMIGNENISILAMRRTSLTIQGILDLVLAPME
jgi:hypothetical protein